MDNILVIGAFVIYLALMMAIGIYYYRKTNSMDDYIIGNRKLGAWVTAMSAEASDMSSFMRRRCKPWSREKNPISMPRKQPLSCNITDNLSRFRPLSNVFWRFLSQQMTRKRANI